MRCVTHMNKSCHSYEYGVSHMNIKCHIYKVCIHVWHDSFICVAWLIPMCDMTYSYVWHGFNICVTCLVHVLLQATGTRIHMYNVWSVTHMSRIWYVTHVSHIWSVTQIHTYVTHMSHMWYVTHMSHKFTHMRDMSHLYVWRNLFLCGMSYMKCHTDSHICHTYVTHVICHTHMKCHTASSTEATVLEGGPFLVSHI